jgi:hypothetical protein
MGLAQAAKRLLLEQNPRVLNKKKNMTLNQILWS